MNNPFTSLETLPWDLFQCYEEISMIKNWTNSFPNSQRYRNRKSLFLQNHLFTLDTGLKFLLVLSCCKFPHVSGEEVRRPVLCSAGRHCHTQWVRPGSSGALARLEWTGVDWSYTWADTADLTRHKYGGHWTLGHPPSHPHTRILSYPHIGAQLPSV